MQTWHAAEVRLNGHESMWAAASRLAIKVTAAMTVSALCW